MTECETKGKKQDDCIDFYAFLIYTVLLLLGLKSMESNILGWFYTDFMGFGS